MTDQSVLCERAIEDRYWVTVELPRTWKERLENHCLEYPMYRSLRDRLIHVARGTISCLLGLLVMCGPCFLVVGIPFIMLRFCQRSPSLALEDVNIRNMAVYQNTTDTPYQVISSI